LQEADTPNQCEAANITGESMLTGLHEAPARITLKPETGLKKPFPRKSSIK
jgi:hypothetical protein